MTYAIYNGEYYISTSVKGYTPTGNLNKAKTWPSKALADSSIRCLPKAMRNLGYHVVALTDHSVEEAKLTSLDPALEQIRKEETALLEAHPDVKAIVHTISSYVDSIANLRAILAQCQQEAALQDKVQEDLLHRIEFESMASGNVAHLGSMLHKCRLKRRIYKNLAQLLYELTAKKPEEIENDYVSMRALALANRKYQMRAEGSALQ